MGVATAPGSKAQPLTVEPEEDGTMTTGIVFGILGLSASTSERWDLGGSAPGSGGKR